MPCWRSVLIFFTLTVTPSIWRRDQPLRGSSGGPNGGGGNRDRGERLMGWLPRLGTPPRNLSPLHLLPPLLPFALPPPPPTPTALPCCRPRGIGRLVEGNTSQPAPPGHYQPHTCCLPMPTLSPVCFRSLTQPWLMGISHFRYLAECADTLTLNFLLPSSSLHLQYLI